MMLTIPIVNRHVGGVVGMKLSLIVAAAIFSAFPAIVNAQTVPQEFDVPTYKGHPTAQDVSVVLKDMYISIEDLKAPALKLAYSEGSLQLADDFRQRITNMESLIGAWGRVQGSPEPPSISELYLINDTFSDVTGHAELFADTVSELDTGGGGRSEAAKSIYSVLKKSNQLSALLFPVIYGGIVNLEQSSKPCDPTHAGQSGSQHLP